MTEQMEMSGKSEGFKDEIHVILPTESFADYVEHPLVRSIYLTDVGFFPNAKDHYKEREDGADQYILIYCMDGKGTIELDGKKYDLKSSDAFCIPRGKKHRYYADKENPWSILWVHFKGENVEYFPLEDCRIVHIGSKHSNNRMVTLFRILFRVLERNYILGNFIYISQVLSLILSEVYYREKIDESTTQDRHVTAVIRFMYENIDRNPTIEEVSKEVELSKSYLHSIFKEQTGKSPMEFFLHLKMKEACKLLKSTNLFIYEVSAQLGYEDQYYFSRIFKKIVGVSPKEYRNGEYIFLG